MHIKDEYQHKLDARLKEFSAELDKLKAKAETLSADARREYGRRVDELSAKRGRADEKLGELKHAGADAWTDLRGGAERAFAEMSRAAKSAASKLKP